MDDTQNFSASEPSAAGRLVFRLAVGLIQGMVLALVVDGVQAKHWPATDIRIFTPSLLLAAFWPLLLLVSVDLRRVTAVAWALLAAAILVGLGAYDIWRAGTPSNIWPSAPLVIVLFPLLFIAHCLVTAGDAEGGLIAPYPRYFDTAWKLSLQIALSLAFVGLFFVVLRIGSELFRLIGIDFLRRLIENRWFSLPASALAFAYAIDLTDVRVGLVRGLRTLALALQSWILPVMVLLAVAFLVALPFTGVEPLWATKSATALLLTAAAFLVFLINAAYRDGGIEEGGRPFLIRIAGTIGAVALVPLVAIACYALMLRIGQHGLTPDRVIAFFCAGTAVCFAMGYAISAVNFGGWLKGVEPTNVFAAFLIVAEILALSTPLADPARLSVTDQVARLASGKTTADAFDYDFLRFQSGRFGRDTLARLARQGIGNDAAKVAELAAAAQKRDFPRRAEFVPAKPTPAEIAAQITVHPKGSVLPEPFLAQDWSSEAETPNPVPRCLNFRDSCDALLVDVDGDGGAEIVVFAYYNSAVFKVASDGRWTSIGKLSPNITCPGVQNALKSGEFTLESRGLKDIVAKGAHVLIEPACPAKQ